MKIVFPLSSRSLNLDCAGHKAAGRGCANDYKAYYANLYSPVDGEVLLFGSNDGGNWIRVTDSSNRDWEMAHLSNRFVRTGNHVSAGQPIGITGNTGAITTGPHLHLQIIRVDGVRLDPWPLLANAPLSGGTMKHDNEIIRNQNTGEFAYVKGGTGKKQLIDAANAGFANITFIDRSRADRPLGEQINNVTPETWATFETVPPGTWF